MEIVREVDIDRLRMFYALIPPRMPRGSPSNRRRILASARFQAFAAKQGLSYREAQKLCSGKSVS